MTDRPSLTAECPVCHPPEWQLHQARLHEAEAVVVTHSADNGYASLPKPLPPHLFYDLRAEQFIVLEYVVAVGWWRRVADYMTETAAIKAARTLSNTGTAAVVMRQVVTQGPMSFVMSALPEEAKP